MSLKTFWKANISTVIVFTIEKMDGGYEHFIVDYLEKDTEKMNRMFEKLYYWMDKKTKIKYIDVVNNKLCITVVEK